MHRVLEPFSLEWATDHKNLRLQYSYGMVSFSREQTKITLEESNLKAVVHVLD